MAVDNGSTYVLFCIRRSEREWLVQYEGEAHHYVALENENGSEYAWSFSSLDEAVSEFVRQSDPSRRELIDALRELLTYTTEMMGGLEMDGTKFYREAWEKMEGFEALLKRCAD